MNHRIRKLHGDQHGQGLVFAALSFLITIMAVAMVYNVGQVVRTRITVQNGADSAALSAAMVQANSLSTIAWLNNGMAQIYHSLLRQIADITTFAVLAEFEDRGGRFRSEGTYAKGYPAPQTDIWGTPSTYDGQIEAAPAPGFACQKLAELTQRADGVFPQAKRWLMELSNIQQAVALAAPVLMSDEIDRVVSAAGATNKSVFFGSRMYPFHASTLDMHIFRLDNGWRIIVERSGETTEIIEVTHPNDKLWIIQNTMGVEQTIITVEQLDDDGNQYRISLAPQGDVWTVTRTETPNGDEWEIIITPAAKPAFTIWFKPFPDLDPNAFGFKTSDMDDWEIYRRDPETGNVQFRQNGEWVDYTDQYRMVNGYKVPVTMSNWVQVGDATVYLGRTPSVHFAHTRARLSNPLQLTHWSGGVTLRVVNDDFSISVAHWQAGPINTSNADGRWHKHFDNRQDYWWQHRLTEIVPNAQWEYNYKEMGSMLRWEGDRYRFALYHGVRWNYGTDYSAMGTAPPTFQAAAGASPETSQFPGWMYWMGVAPVDSADDGVGMTFGAQSPEQNRWDAGAEPDRSYFYQIRTCWHCSGSGEDPEEAGEVCPVCHGIRNGVAPTPTHVCIRPIDTLHRGTKPTADWQDYVTLAIEEDGSYGVEGKVREPLVLTEEFFKYGINVAVWANPWPGLTPDADAEAESTGLKPMLFSGLNPSHKDNYQAPRLPGWGCMAVASARAVFDDRDYGGIGWGFPALTVQQRDDWIEGVSSQGNLYVTEWTARLVSTKTNIDRDDLELDGYTVDGMDYDTPAGWLYDIFAQGQTFQSSKIMKDYSLEAVPRLGQMRRRDGRRLNFVASGTDEVKFDDHLYH